MFASSIEIGVCFSLKIELRTLKSDLSFQVIPILGITYVEIFKEMRGEVQVRTSLPEIFEISFASRVKQGLLDVVIKTLDGLSRIEFDGYGI